MWAIDHRSKRIVEVPRFPSRDVRTALLQRNALRDFVLYHNSLAKDRAGSMLKRCFSSLVEDFFCPNQDDLVKKKSY